MTKHCTSAPLQCAADAAFLEQKKEQLLEKQRKAQMALEFRVQREIQRVKEVVEANLI
eukprot:SAG31_NODE_17956_length_652_cov_0.515371_2_plen_57_part_01